MLYHKYVCDTYKNVPHVIIRSSSHNYKIKCLFFFYSECNALRFRNVCRRRNY